MKWIELVSSKLRWTILGVNLRINSRFLSYPSAEEKLWKMYIIHIHPVSNLIYCTSQD